MLSEEQLKQVISENEYLQVQLQDVNDILIKREQELLIINEYADEASELRSKLEVQLNELHSMQNRIGEKQRQALGAEEREIELQEELTTSAKLQQQYNELLQENTYMQTQLSDLNFQVEELNARCIELQKIANRIGELESKLSITTIERDELKTALSVS